MAFLLGRKIGMSQIYDDKGNVIPVTVVEVEPNTITQVKTKKKDGYEAVQVEAKSEKRKAKKKEFRFSDQETRDKRQVGEKIDVSIFSVGDAVKVTGLTKGKGFQGVMKRHGFHGMPFSHGHHHVARHGGSIGQRFPQHTLKGMRMPGRMGHNKLTVRGLRIAAVDKENNLLAIKGAVPGNKGGIIAIVSQV